MLPWEEDDTFIRSGHRSSDEFQPDTFRTIELSRGDGIKAVTAKPKGKHTMEVQSYLFEKSKGWTLEKAKAWFEQHQRKERESFQWLGEIARTQQGRNLIRGKALHPIRTVHPEEWPQVREYLEEELDKSASTLVGKPLILDHNRPLRGEVVNAEYKDGAIQYVAKLDDSEILKKVAEAELKYRKDPAESLRVTVLGDSRIVAGETIRVTSPNEGIDADYRIQAVDHFLDDEGEFETSMTLIGEPPRLAEILSETRRELKVLMRSTAYGKLGR